MSTPKKPRRGRGEGSIELLPDGRFRAVLSLGKKAGGKRRRLKFYGKTKKEALRKLREAQQRHNAGTLADAGTLTVGEWLTRWLDFSRAKIEPATFRRYGQTVAAHLTPHLGELPLGKVSAVHVEGLYAALERSGVSRSEQRRAGGTLSQALRHAVRLRLLQANPCQDISRPKKRRAEICPLAREDVVAFLRAAESDRLYALFVLWLDTGARPGELNGLHWPEVDLSAGAVRFARSLSEIEGVLRLKDTKTPKGRRTLAVSAFTLAALSSHRERMRREGRDVAAGPVFVAPRGGYLRQGHVQSQVFDRLLKVAGVRRVRPYDLRHTCASLLLQHGVNIKVVSERLGHASVQLTLDLYCHVMPGMQEAAAGVMDSLLRLSPDSPPAGKKENISKDAKADDTTG